jgi:hypothetical protein
MVEPRMWYHVVISVGLLQAALSAASIPWIAREARAALAGFDVPGPAQLILFTFTSIFLPFFAYAADSQKLLLRNPGDPSCSWQVAGGFAGMSLSLAIMHALPLAKVFDGYPIYMDHILLAYRLIFPAFIVGSIGAGAGMIVALLCHGLIAR